VIASNSLLISLAKRQERVGLRETCGRVEAAKPIPMEKLLRTRDWRVHKENEKNKSRGFPVEDSKVPT
jgi:hypothetical protein